MVNPIGTDRAQRCSVVAVDHVLGQRARREERCFLPGSVSSRDQLPPLWRDPGAVERRLLGRLDFYRRRTNRECLREALFYGGTCGSLAGLLIAELAR